MEIELGDGKYIDRCAMPQECSHRVLATFFIEVLYRLQHGIDILRQMGFINFLDEIYSDSKTSNVGKCAAGSVIYQPNVESWKFQMVPKTPDEYVCKRLLASPACWVLWNICSGRKKSNSVCPKFRVQLFKHPLYSTFPWTVLLRMKLTFWSFLWAITFRDQPSRIFSSLSHPHRARTHTPCTPPPPTR